MIYIFYKMSNFDNYEAAKTLISISKNQVNPITDNIYNLISEEKKKKEYFEYQYKSVSKNNLIMMLEIFIVKKEIEEIKKNNFIYNSDVDNIIINNKNKIINNIKNKKKSHNYNLRPRK